MNILILDDDQNRHNKFAKENIGNNIDHVFDAEDAIESLTANLYDLVMLDHDLAEEHYSRAMPDDLNGQYVCKELAKIGANKQATFVIHSLNHSAARSMYLILTEAGYDNVIIKPFGWTKTWQLDNSNTNP